MAEKDDVIQQVAALKKLSTGQLRKRYLEVFGEETKSNNKPYLFKRIAYRIQEKKWGGLSPRARDRAAELAKDAPIRRGRLSKIQPQAKNPLRDPRLPAPGAVLTRTFGKHEHAVKVLADGFEYKGKPFRSLSAIAREITGTSWNGFAFFGRGGKEQA